MTQRFIQWYQSCLFIRGQYQGGYMVLKFLKQKLKKLRVGDQVKKVDVKTQQVLDEEAKILYRKERDEALNSKQPDAGQEKVLREAGGQDISAI